VALVDLLSKYEGEFHHGDCVGADAQAHEYARRDLKYKVVLHPPAEITHRAWCDGDKVLKPKPYLARNKDIVLGTDLLVATPKETDEKLRSGTWSTIRFARRHKRRLVVILPTGQLTK